MWAPGCHRGSDATVRCDERQRDDVLIVRDDLSVGHLERDAALDVQQRSHVADRTP